MKTAGLLFLTLLLSGCSREIKISRGPDGANAYRTTAEFSRIVPRHSGTPGAKKAAEWIRDRALKMPNVKVRIQEFTGETPMGPTVFRNVEATLEGGRDFIILGAHYDAKKLESVPDFPGANDGASGVGAALEVLRIFAESKQTPPVTLKVVFFDGEECLFSYTENDGLHGSRYYAKHLKFPSHCRAMILLDMVGDRDLDLRLPSDTHPGLAKLALESSPHLSPGGPAMIDDHTPFQERGIPSIDLIDFEYGPGNIYWHTRFDTMDKISAESLQKSADAAFQMILKLMNGYKIK